nr:hypothetical protein [Tanacetum cinerariifolium]
FILRPVIPIDTAILGIFPVGDGKPVTCCKCEGPLRGGFCSFCDLKAENSFTYAYSFNNTSSNFNHLPQPQYENYLCELCGNNSHYGYDCQHFPLVYEQEPSYNQNYNDNYYPHDLPSFLCCDNCGGSCEIFQCQPMNQNIDSSGSDQNQTPQYPIIHPPSQEMSKEVFQAKGGLMKSFYDDEEYSIQYKEYLEKSDAIAPVLPTEEPEYSLSMGYEHISTTPETKLDEVIKSSAKNLLPIPSEYEVTSDDDSECDVPVKDDSSLVFTTFSNPLFDDNDDFTSSDDESLPEEDVPIKNFKVYSSPLFDDEEINSNEIDPHCFNAENFLVNSLILIQFYQELRKPTLMEEIRFVENLLYDNSSPRPPKELNAKIADTIIKSLSQSPILVKDSDSLMDEIDLFLATDDLLPPRIESDGYDSEGDIHFLEELLVDDSIPLPEKESSNFDYHDDSSFPRPPPEPPDVEFFFDFEPNLEVISAAMNNIDELNEDECFDPGGEINVFANVEDDDYFPFIFVIRKFLPYLIYPEVFPLLLSAESEDTIFDPGISV